ncbi:hypothetical protein BKA69DRAFT_1061871 [Paraphysoderma sedebokerense]|nr:hypothetical protein BKA69DRAFT_1061871 [Paraphysoderma sedebokerense]
MKKRNKDKGDNAAGSLISPDQSPKPSPGISHSFFHSTNYNDEAKAAPDDNISAPGFPTPDRIPYIILPSDSVASPHYILLPSNQKPPPNAYRLHSSLNEQSCPPRTIPYLIIPDNSVSYLLESTIEPPSVPPVVSPSQIAQSHGSLKAVVLNSGGTVLTEEAYYVYLPEYVTPPKSLYRIYKAPDDVMKIVEADCNRNRRKRKLIATIGIANKKRAQMITPEPDLPSSPPTTSSPVPSINLSPAKTPKLTVKLTNSSNYSKPCYPRAATLQYLLQSHAISTPLTSSQVRQLLFKNEQITLPRKQLFASNALLPVYYTNVVPTPEAILTSICAALNNLCEVNICTKVQVDGTAYDIVVDSEYGKDRRKRSCMWAYLLAIDESDDRWLKFVPGENGGRFTGSCKHLARKINRTGL